MKPFLINLQIESLDVLENVSQHHNKEHALVHGPSAWSLLRGHFESMSRDHASRYFINRKTRLCSDNLSLFVYVSTNISL